MQRGNEQREYLAPILRKYNIRDRRFIAYDPAQEIHQFRMAYLAGATETFNEIEA